MSTSTKTKIRQLSAKLGLEEEMIIDKAVSLFSTKVKAWHNLKKETKQWEALSDEVWQQIKD